MSDRPIVVMGVAGSGKTAVAQGLAEALGQPFVDADDLHPASNVTKMAAGDPLDDDDRAPWLDAVADALGSTPPPVIACSALKRAYRDRLRRAGPVRFIHLVGERALIADRMAARDDHFMPLSLLDDQFATLEALEPDENAALVAIEPSLDEVITAAVEAARH